MPADIQEISGSQGLASISNFCVMKQFVDLAVPLCDFADIAGKLGPPMLAHRIVLALALI